MNEDPKKPELEVKKTDINVGISSALSDILPEPATDERCKLREAVKKACESDECDIQDLEYSDELSTRATLNVKAQCFLANMRYIVYRLINLLNSSHNQFPFQSLIKVLRK